LVVGRRGANKIQKWQGEIPPTKAEVFYLSVYIHVYLLQKYVRVGKWVGKQIRPISSPRLKFQSVTLEIFLYPVDHAMRCDGDMTAQRSSF
jgi:hypothetical protein